MRMPLRTIVAALVLGFGLAAPVHAGAPANGVHAVDSLMQAAFAPDAPGAALLVVKNGRTLLRQGYGLADLELGVPVQPDMVFRLGSITKQFTAVAILMLEAEGKLTVGDDIRKHLPDFNTQGRTITVEHLLTHTSGIPSYTELPEWLPLWRKDMSLTELIALFEDKPLQFEPGAKWSYNNSGYVLLGAIIEKVSGTSYEEFVTQRIFAPLGMQHSSYGSTERVIPRRVPGYSRGTDGFVNAAYLSMTQPYAAGSLLSTVDDLAIWDAALASGKLLTPAQLAPAHRPYTLRDGRTVGYGFGWGIGAYEGRTTIEHGGGINGFSTYAISIPADTVYVALLTNRDTGDPNPEPLAFKAAALAIGHPVREPVAITLAPDVLQEYVGVYTIDEEQTRVITLEGTQLYSLRSGGERRRIFPLGNDEFFFENSGTRLRFKRGADGAITSHETHARIQYGPPETAARTNLPLPQPRQAVTLDPGSLPHYVGEYELAPGFTLTVVKQGSTLTAQATGQQALEILPESTTVFFYKVVDATLEFVLDADGIATALTLHQGGQHLPGRKIK